MSGLWTDGLVEVSGNTGLVTVSPGLLYEDAVFDPDTQMDELQSFAPIAKLIQSVAGPNVLEFGCGPAHLSHHFPSYIGLDGNPDFVKANPLLTRPERFLTVDLRKPVRLRNSAGDVLADTIISFEVLEHIPEDNVGTLLDSMRAHCHPEARLFITASLKHRLMDEVHLTVKSRPWWLRKFREYGFVQHEDATSMITRMYEAHPFNWRPFTTHVFYLRPE